MSNVAAAEPLAIADGSRYYTVISLAALFGTVLPLLARDLGAWSLFPALVGCIAVAARMRSGFFLFMLALLWLFVSDRVGVTPLELADFLISNFTSIFSARRFYGLPRHYSRPHMQAAEPVLDIVLCLAVIAFAAAFFRLIAITRHVFPLDRRRQRFLQASGQTPRFMRLSQGDEKRSPGLVEPIEIVPLLMAAAAVVIVGQLFWVWLGERDSFSDLSFTLQSADESDRLVTQAVSIRIPNNLWRMLLILWVFFLAILPIASVLSFLGMRRATAAEAALFLQDCMWRETRREQARNMRWLAWAEQKYERKRANRDWKLGRRGKRPV